MAEVSDEKPNEFSSDEESPEETSDGSEEGLVPETGNNEQNKGGDNVQEDSDSEDDPYSEDDFEETAGQISQIDGENSNVKPDIGIIDWSYVEVETNEKYHSLSFQFTNWSDPNEIVYEAYITGINLVPESDQKIEDVIVPLLKVRLTKVIF